MFLEKGQRIYTAIQLIRTKSPTAANIFHSHVTFLADEGPHIMNTSDYEHFQFLTLIILNTFEHLIWKTFYFEHLILNTFHSEHFSL